MDIRAQVGPQEMFLRSAVDIAIYGGAAGGGKTYALLLESLYHYQNPKFGGTIFRRTQPQITAEGGLLDTSMEIYPFQGGKFNYNPALRWKFPSGAKVEFRHLQHEKNMFDWQGAQIAFIGFDELSHFTEKQFFYLLSRNRSLCGVSPYMRATTNPDPNSWVKGFIKWWLDGDDEYADPDKAGAVRWMLRMGDDLLWFESEAKALEYAEDKSQSEIRPKSVTFIPSSIYDNKIMLEADPGYLANLMSLPRVERERLLGGNWKVRAHAGDIFSRDDFEIVDAAPIADSECRCWDRAATKPSATNKDPDWTVGAKMQRNGNIYTITDINRFRTGPGKVKNRIKNTASRDGNSCIVALFIDPGQAGKVEIHDYFILLVGYVIETIRETTKKYLKWRAFASQAQAGNVKLLRGSWNDPFLTEVENVAEDESEYAHDDQTDAACGAFEQLSMATRWVPV